jgi:hypothetical protein
MTSSTENDWQQTLTKMANLTDLSTAVSDGVISLNNNRGKVVTTLQEMTKKLSEIQSKIDHIKNDGNTAIKSCREAIKMADPAQGKIIDEIKKDIVKMTDMTVLQQNIKETQDMVSTLAGVTGATGPATAGPPGPVTGAPARSTGAPPKTGGYTYGKSRKKGKGRRKRTKKSRKKRSGKK